MVLVNDCHSDLEEDERESKLHQSTEIHSRGRSDDEWENQYSYTSKP